jgi:hypothetical protein
MEKTRVLAEKNKEFTLILHGPVTIYTMFTIYRYMHDYNIVIVSPRINQQNSITKEIDFLVNSPDSNISLILYGDILKPQYNNTQNRYLHFFSVGLGLSLCTTPYAIKMRNDEFYSNLKPFEESIKKFPDKIVTNEVFFRNSTIPIHPSDHLVGGSVDVMKNVFDKAREHVQVSESKLQGDIFTFLRATEFFKTNKAFAAEQILGIAAIQVVGKEELTNENFINLMKSVFRVVPSDELGVFRIMYNSHKSGVHEYFDTSYFSKHLDVKHIGQYS